MIRRNHEKERGLQRTPERRGELTPEDKLQKYAELLLVGPEGEDRVAVAEHLLADGVEPGHTVAKATFYKRDGGYFIMEYRNHNPDPVFTSYAMPVAQVYTPENVPEDAKWATGMIRHRWTARSIEDIDNLAPVVGVIEAFFGKLPT